jgi:hypothetical protein
MLYEVSRQTSVCVQRVCYNVLGGAVLNVLLRHDHDG